MPTVEHPRIRPGVLEDRAYQAAIAGAALERPTLVVLPTGLGKTAVALRVVAETLRREPTRSILFLAPTRPLVLQHAKTLAETLLAPAPLVWTGHVAPEKRALEGPGPRVIVATPQVIAHDLAKGSLGIDEFSLVVFDEAHRAVGDYAYVAIGEAVRAARHTLVLAMTASPGASLPRIRTVWANLGLQHFEYRTIEDPDVRPYLFGIDVETRVVQVPVELQEVAIRLRAAIDRQAQTLHHLRLVPEGPINRRVLLEVGRALHGAIASARRAGTPLEGSVWTATTAHSVAMKELHALELAESQGVASLRGFLDRQRRPGRSGRMTPAQRAFLADPDIAKVLERIDALDLEHPKVPAAVGLVREALRAAPNARVLLFTQYRSTADVLLEALRALADVEVRSARFVGQASREGDRGLSQKEQAQILDAFRAGTINVLVATSVAEEGLDVPATDLVIFYEPIPDLVRTIQRRGRTGRSHAGRVVVLVAAGTRDVGVDRASSGRERRMHAMLETLETESAHGTVRPPPRATVQRVMTDFPSSGPD
ncbi:MAG TPA: helicase-related protein [Thermoplasmata archaeon]|nr:helicase-related protein [Thermoplasmata archaeon]